jgi:hypothetical protein
MKEGALVSRLAVVTGTMLRPLVQCDGLLQPAPRRNLATLVQDYGSLEAYLEEQRRCEVYAVDRQARERHFA